MAVALADLPERFLDQPEGVINLKIDPVTGKLASPQQENAIFEYFLTEHAPHPGNIRLGPTESTDQEIKPEDIF